MNRQPTLIGELVEARPLRAEDFDALYAAASDPLTWQQHPEPDRWREDVFRGYFDDQLASGGALAVLDRASGEVIGVSRYDCLDEERSEVEIGWTFLARRYWGGPTNADLKRIMLEHAFRAVQTVVFLVGDENMRSRRAVEKLGAVETGRRRSGVLYELPARASWRATAPRDDVIVLREWRPGDASDELRDPELGRFFGRALDGSAPAADDLPSYAILERSSGDVVGRVWCRAGARPPEVGYVLRRRSWGRGYATRAVRLVTDWLLGIGGYDAVELCIHPGNERSLRVAERAGFRPAGAVEEYARFADGTRRALKFVARA